MCVLILFSSIFIGISSGYDFKNCGGTGVTSVDLTPNPPKSGQNLMITINGTGTMISSATLETQVGVFGVVLYHESDDFCTLVSGSCPTSSAYSITKTQSIPSSAPHGSFFATLTLKSGDSELWCIQIAFSIESGQKIKYGDVGINYEDFYNLHTTFKSQMNTDDNVNKFNSAQNKWIAGHNSRFENTTYDSFTKTLGALRSGRNYMKSKKYNSDDFVIPKSFDARTEWGFCSSISTIRDQGSCGSCWAFGAAEAMTDRVCVATRGVHTPILSVEELVSCCDDCGDGCDGGYPEEAWMYWEINGLETGGPYQSKTGCYPYEVHPCEHHINGTRYPQCGDIVSTPSCRSSCIDGSKWSDKYYGNDSYIFEDVKSAMIDMVLFGPIESAFNVYSDFPLYKSGVYSHTSSVELGGHAIKILGWGTENSTPYWLVANSWNSDWGTDGYFKILRGSDECGIESGMVAGTVDLDKLE